MADDLCSYCGNPGTETVVHFTDWITWVCHRCAVLRCDPLRDLEVANHG